MKINNVMRGYIEQAIDERLSETHPDLSATEHSNRLKDTVIKVAWWEHPVFARALELACADLEAKTTPPSAEDFEAYKAEKRRLGEWGAEEQTTRAEERAQ